MGSEAHYLVVDTNESIAHNVEKYENVRQHAHAMMVLNMVPVCEYAMK